jgi:hypothetical protein
MRIAVDHAFIVAAAVAALSLFATERAWAQTEIVVINPDTGERAKAVCDSEPPRDAQRDWLKRHCRPDDPRGKATGQMDSFFDVWTEISFD